MSILLKHLKMPKIGETRTLVIDGNGDVYVNGAFGRQRLVDYAVELPQDDLISKDKLLELEMPDRGQDYKLGWEDLMAEVRNVKAVVKGETEV